MASGSDPVLSLQNVYKHYVTDGADVRALQGVTLDVYPGEFVALVGRSGCGKSTLLHLAGAMDFPTEGTVLIRGTATSGLPDSGLTRIRREEVGFIFQSFHLLPTLSVVENVELPLLLAGHRSVRNVARQCLAQTEMDGYDDRMPYQLSGGQMQRVAIARALVHAPSLVLADEPTGNLDSATGAVILQLLRRIADERRAAVIMATHSSEAVSSTDRVVRMSDGLITAVEQAAQIL